MNIQRLSSVFYPFVLQLDLCVGKDRNDAVIARSCRIYRAQGACSLVDYRALGLILHHPSPPIGLLCV